MEARIRCRLDDTLLDRELYLGQYKAVSLESGALSPCFGAFNSNPADTLIETIDISGVRHPSLI